MTIHNASESVPFVGQRVIGYNIRGAESYNGMTGTVTKATLGLYVTAEFKSIPKPDDTIELSFMEWSYPDGSTLTVSEPLEFTLGRDGVTVPASADVPALRDIIERLSNELADTKRNNTEATRYMNDYRSDIDTIGGALMEEAERRGWCAEYDEFVESVNQSLTRASLPTRERVYEVTWTEIYRVTVARSGTYTAASEDEAIDLARDEDEDSSLILESIREGDFERVELYSDEYEAQEV
jgi:hypothetical protein